MREKELSVGRTPESREQYVIGNDYAKFGEMLDVRVNLLVAVEMRVVICAKVFEGITAEDEVNSDEQGMSHRHSGSVLATMCDQAVVLRGEELTYMVVAANAGAAIANTETTTRAKTRNFLIFFIAIILLSKRAH